MERIEIDVQECDACLDSGEFPEALMSKIEAAIERMKADPGGDDEEILLVLKNDFEAEEDADDESEDDETETQKEPSK